MAGQKEMAINGRAIVGARRFLQRHAEHGEYNTESAVNFCQTVVEQKHPWDEAVETGALPRLQAG